MDEQQDPSGEEAPDLEAANTPESEEVDPQIALREAVARARQVARAKGLRPGARPAQRTRWVDRQPSRQDRDPATITDQMGKLLLDRGWRVDVAAGSVLAKWAQIVGAEVAVHTKAIGFEEGVLTVRTDSTAWRTQLEFMTSTLLGRIEDEVGARVVTDLKFVGPSAPSWSRGPRKVHGGRGPRDTYG